MKILISPYSRVMRNGKMNPKNYPYWQEFINLLNKNNHSVLQIGTGDELRFDNVTPVWGAPMVTLFEFIRKVNFWMSVDNFLPHLVHTEKLNKKGVVIFGKSDPLIYGYKENLNILLNRKNLRPDQFNMWEQCEFDASVFMSAGQVFEMITRFGILKN